MGSIEQERGVDRAGRRRKRFLTPQEKYEIWLQLLRGETTIIEAADRAGVDRSTIMKLRQVARQGALDALAASHPGVKAGGIDPDLADARAEVAPPERGAEGDGRAAHAGGGKRALGLSGGVPRRVDSATKAGLVELIDRAVKDGWDHRRACAYLELAERRAWRWRRRRGEDRLEDRSGGGHALHGLLASEAEAIVALFEEWGEIDRSHRKLAHRGSYLGRVWVSPSSVRRVLAAQGLHLRRPPRRGTSARRPFPDWASYTKNSIWIYDNTHFAACRGVAVTAIMDLVTRKWLVAVVSAEETSTQVQAAFIAALEAEGLWSAVEARQAAEDLGVVPSADDRAPILLAVSDNGPQMTSGSTREFMALCAIAQHFGRPGTPTDQAWIETLFGHVKGEWPHLDKIADPAVLRAELARVRHDYNSVRLHAGVGYVTPHDEHEGRGPAIRAARRIGLEKARQRRIAYHRQHQPPDSRNVD